MRRLAPLALAVALAASCGGEGAVTGRVTEGELPVAAAKVEVYLEAGRFRASTPFAVAYTDERGTYTLTLPSGSYHLVARGEKERGERLYGEHPANPVRVARRDVAGIDIPLGPAVASRDYRGPGNSGIVGRVEAADAAGAFVYVYRDETGGLMGPSYLVAEPAAEDGSFRVNLHPGNYWVAVRRKSGGGKAGFVGSGDLTGTYGGNPARVKEGEFADLGSIALGPAGEERLAEAAAGRRTRSGPTGITGLVTDGDGSPVAGLFVIVYDHPQMIGRPAALGVSDEEGRFTLDLPSGGTWYLGARQERSGPRNPGELAGGYEGTPDHSVKVPEGAWVEGLTIRVEEVW